MTLLNYVLRFAILGLCAAFIATSVNAFQKKHYFWFGVNIMMTVYLTVYLIALIVQRL